MEIVEHKVKTLSEFVDYINLCSKKEYTQFSNFDRILYRGHANKEWNCLPKLFRNAKWFNNEKTIINEIIRRCPIEFEVLSAFEKLVKMQHFGAPTRLLDFTGNPLIALYFACDDNTQLDKDGVVMVCSFPVFWEKQIPVEGVLKDVFPDFNNMFISINQENLSPLINSSNTLGLSVELKNERIRNQDGYFVLYTYHGEYTKIFNPLEENNCIQERLIIPSECKRSILQELSRCGINRAFVYPELENQIIDILNRL